MKASTFTPMQYEDTITIPTPEGIELQYTLAGVGSRFIAELVDVLLRLVVLGILTGVLAALGGGSAAAIIDIVAAFLAIFVYDIVFEVWGGGRTPGKRWSGLRVMMAGGQPVGLGSSAVRTLLRILDQWATLSIVEIISISVTSRNQWIGDLAAGTIVVRERRARVKLGSMSTSGESGLGLDVTRVSVAELAAIRDFIGRRDGLDAKARRRVAEALADGLGPKVGGLPPGGLAPERLLEAIVSFKDRPSGAGAP
jgi:uncharacterized RDD family membrane protein YckC